jgi:hypothetical protein
MKKLHGVISVLIIVFVFNEIGNGQTKYKTYTNPRFGYEIKYPEELKIQPSSFTGDGRVFLSADKHVEMRVWGQYNALFDSLKNAYLSDLKERSDGITYKVLLKNSYVISGVRGKKIFYQKTMRRGKDGDSGAVFYTFTIEYLKTDKSKFDQIVRKISDSFKFDPNADV